MKVIAHCADSSATGWTVLNADVTSLAGSTTVIWSPRRSAYSLEFDKTNGSADSTVAGAYMSFSGDAVKEVLRGYRPVDRINWLVYIGDLTNVASSFVRIGSSATAYVEYRYADTSHTATMWTRASAELGEGYATGIGLDWENVAYLAVGLNMDAESNALADIKFDCVFLTQATETND